MSNRTAETVAVPSKRSQKRRQATLKRLIDWHGRQHKKYQRLSNWSADTNCAERFEHRVAAEAHRQTLEILRELTP